MKRTDDTLLLGGGPTLQRVPLVTRPTVDDLPLHTEGRYERFAKPVIDRVGALVLIVLCAPIMLVTALAVGLTLGSPVILRQHRVGHQGKTFRIFKFRTMRPDRRLSYVSFNGGDRRLHHKVPHDPRLTGLGRFLRSWSLDELPQLFNVVSGQLSLVGPRPEMLDIVARYAPWQHRRHEVKPGLTGLWQVSARGDAPMHELTEIDLEYIGKISLWTDLRILVLTVPAALGLRRGF
jgi:lipopolysaccharide/colanic/teichoic acid biosynthesis glycosyltransferase